MKKAFAFLLLALFSAPMLSSCDDIHDYHEEIIKQPTCTEDGVGILRCADCDEVTPEIVIPAYGHKFVTKTVAPTCTKEGYDVTYCVHCGLEQKRSNQVPATGHHFVTTVIEPGCINAGHVESYCSVCGQAEFAPYFTDSLGHQYQVVATIAPTCTERGYDVMECQVCHKQMKDHYVASLGHDYQSEILSATCTLPTRYVTTCSRCSYYSETAHGEALGHNLIHHEGHSPTCTKKGYLAYDTCSRCDYSTYHEVDELGHDYQTIDYLPTCTEKGYSQHICRVCGDSYIDNEVPALGHDLIHHEAKAATCDHGGYLEYDTCSRCDYTTYEAVGALGIEHDYVVKQVVNPTRTERGYTLYECSHCHDTYKSDFRTQIKPMRVMSPNNAIALGSHDENVSNSIRDDDAYYFVLYLGQAQDMPLHSFASFQWNSGMASMASYPKETIKATPMDLQDAHAKRMAVVNNEVAKSLLKSAPIASSHEVERVLDHSLDSKIGKLLDDLGGYKAIEINDPSFTSLTSKINGLTSSYRPGANLDQYEENTTYSYLAVADIDFYVGVRYDLISGKYSYCPYSVMLGEPQEMLFASDQYGMSNFGRALEVESTISALMSKPETYQTNHPVIYHSWQRLDSSRVMNNYQPNTFSCTWSDISTYYEQGYDMASIVINWKWGKDDIWAGTEMQFELQFNDGSRYGGFDLLYHDYKDFIDTAFIETSAFAAANGFKLVWNNTKVIGYLKVYEVRVGIYLFSNSAYKDGAYKASEIAYYRG